MRDAPASEFPSVPPGPTGARGAWIERGGLAAVVLCAALLCFWHLGERSLWQDEAETALLGRSVLQTGQPLARFDHALVHQLSKSTDERGRWTFHPWGQFYLAALGMAILGENEVGARAPFALCGVLTVLLLWIFVRRNWRSRPTAILAAGLLATSPAFVLHARQCRYHAPSALACLGVVFAFVELLRRPGRTRSALLGLALAAQFYIDFGTFFALLPGLLAGFFVLRGGRRGAIPAAAGLLLCLVLIAPGLALHWHRFSGGDRPMGFARAIVTQLVYLDGWLIPLLLLLPAAGVWSARRISGRTGLSAEDRITLTCGLILVLAVAGLAFAVPWEFLRYLIPLMSLAKVLLAVTIVALYSRLRRLWGSRLPAGLVAGAVCALVVFTNVLTIPMQLITRSRLYEAPGLARESVPVLRSEFAGLLTELSTDFVGPNRIVRNVARNLARPGETVVINYGDLPLMFYRPDLLVRGGHSWRETVRDVSDTPELVLVRLYPFSDMTPYVEDLLRRREYLALRPPMPAMIWGNIPEPRDHAFTTPRDRHELLVLLRADLEDRLADLPHDPDALRARWWRAP